MVVRWSYVDLYYGVIKKYLCYERVVHVRYLSIDDFVITNDKPPSGHALVDLVHLVLGQDVASLLSLCMAEWLRKWRRGWLYVRSNTKNAKSLLFLTLIGVKNFKSRPICLDPT